MNIILVFANIGRYSGNANMRRGRKSKCKIQVPRSKFQVPSSKFQDRLTEGIVHKSGLFSRAVAKWKMKSANCKLQNPTYREELCINQSYSVGQLKNEKWKMKSAKPDLPKGIVHKIRVIQPVGQVQNEKCKVQNPTYRKELCINQGYSASRAGEPTAPLRGKLKK